MYFLVFVLRFTPINHELFKYRCSNNISNWIRFIYVNAFESLWYVIMLRLATCVETWEYWEESNDIDQKCLDHWEFGPPYWELIINIVLHVMGHHKDPLVLHVSLCYDRERERLLPKSIQGYHDLQKRLGKLFEVNMVKPHNLKKDIKHLGKHDSLSPL